MTKAVLLIDMPKQVCQGCTLCYGTKNDDEYMCCATGRIVPDGEKPDWCPLRKLPEKKDTIIYENDDWGTADLKKKGEGWNACLDEIMKKR